MNKSNLSESFNKAKLIDDIQKELLKKEVYRDIEIVNYIKQEIMWGSNKTEIFKEIKKDFKANEQEFDLYYKQALDLIERKAWI